MLIESLKNVAKKLPFFDALYLRLKNGKHLRDGKKLFTNPEDYARSLYEKNVSTVDLVTRDGLRITIRQNIWDARIVSEIFFEKPYVKHFKLPPSPTVIDIGGYIGDFSLYATHYLNAKKVLVFEPTKENFEILERNILNNSFGSIITAINKAVSSNPSINLNVSIDDCNEIHASSFWQKNDSTSRTIPAITLQHALESHSIKHVDLLKIDCEGGEYDILLNMPANTMNCIQNIVFEHHDIGDHANKLTEIKSKLSCAGFKIITEGPICYAAREIE